MIGHSRDENIGKPTDESIVTVKNLDTLISSTNITADNIEESIIELKKIRIGTALINGQEIEEVD